MFGLFKKDPTKALRKRYEALMKEGMELQRSGDIQAFATKMDEAEKVRKELEAQGVEV